MKSQGVIGTLANLTVTVTAEIGRVNWSSLHFELNSSGIRFCFDRSPTALNLTWKLRFSPLSRLVCFSHALNVRISSWNDVDDDDVTWSEASNFVSRHGLCNVYSRIVPRHSGTVGIPVRWAIAVKSDVNVATELSLCRVPYFDSAYRDI